MSQAPFLQHIGFIMDGNRRWAKKLSKVASFGHTAGGEKVEEILALCLKKRIPYVSMWTLSRENILERAPEEIATIFSLFRKHIPRLIPKLIAQGIRFEWIGNRKYIPKDILTMLDTSTLETESCITMTLILAIAYGGQDEIIRGVQKCLSLGIEPSSLDEKTFLSYLDTGTYPPPDLIIRTGGSIRHSGYFLYQSAYSEYFFTDILWPDMTEMILEEAIDSFKNTKRNFGK